jgi:hypothetical protein
MTDEHIIACLLDEAPARQRRDLAVRCFADDELDDRCAALEENLVDDYVRGRLPDDLRRRFEAGYLQLPYRRQKVVMAAALLKILDKHEPPFSRAAGRDGC